MTPPDILLKYESGLRGFIPDARADAGLVSFLRDIGGYADAGDAIDDYRLRDSGKDKVMLPFLAAVNLYPGCLPGGYQQRGSCVAWSTRNAALVSYCASLVYGANPERYRAPAVPPVGVDNGVASTEGIYWFRRHGGDGWQGSAAAQVAIEECGLLLRQNYPEIGIDLTAYDPQTEGKWGTSLPPENVRAVCRQHLCGSATVVKTWEQFRDMIANGYAVSTAGMEAWGSQRDGLGVCKRNYAKSWAHAMAAIASDDRPEIHERYGCGLALIQNSWPHSYLSGPTAIRGTNFNIPPGSFWARWDDMKDRYMVAMGPSKGWPANKLPNWGLKGII